MDRGSKSGTVPGVPGQLAPQLVEMQALWGEPEQVRHEN